MRLAVAAMALASVLLPPQPQPQPDGGIDRKALEALLARKNLKLPDFGFDFDHLNSMPPNSFAHYSAPTVDRGQLKLYREIQKAPLTFPDRIQAMARSAAAFTDWGALIGMLSTAIDHPFDDPKPAPISTTDLSALPEALREPLARLVGACQVALSQPDGVRASVIIMRTIEETRAAFAAFAASDGKTKLNVRLTTPIGGVVVHAGQDPAKYFDDEASLWIDLGGDDDYEGSFAGADEHHRLKILLDFAGNDTYHAKRNAQGAAEEGGIGILCDFSGDDRYEIEDSLGQGAAINGTGILYDAAGNDTYIGNHVCQGAANLGIGILVDRAGNDSYEAVYTSQACAASKSAALLLDLDGNDEYLAHDPMHGHPVTNPAPQDEKHSTSMCQGAATGDNSPDALAAGGIALLVDARGNDRYRAGCWAQGVGYFMGIGALCDLDGDDSYSAWVYIMGAGAHGGFGLLYDRRGDDVYRVGGWNALGMAVDYGIGMALDGAGHDKYLNVAGGLGWCTGLGIALFQDAGGDDVYDVRDSNLGYGHWYEKEDYNEDKQITPAEKRHWGIFLDLGGLDRYPGSSKGKNGAGWDQSEFAGGVDLPTPRPPWRIPDTWEEMTAAEILKRGASAPAADRAAFALEHGLLREALELLPPADAEARFGKEVLAIREKAKSAKEIDALLAECAALPEARRALGRQVVRDALQTRLETWVASLKPLLDRRAALDVARAEVLSSDPAKRPAALKKLQSIWAGRAAAPAKVDAVSRAIAPGLDALDRGWRDRLPIAAANVAMDALTLETIALSPAERTMIARSQELEKRRVAPVLAALNDVRGMLGRARVAEDQGLAKLSAAQAAAEGKAAKPADGVQLCAKARSADDALNGWLLGQELATLTDERWTRAGFGAAGAWFAVTLRAGK